MKPVGGPSDFSITLIGRDRFHVRLDRLLPAAAANIDVRRHVHVVREAGLQVAQAIRRGDRALRMRRSFDRVNVKMIRERMFRIHLQHGVECRENFIGAGIWLAFGRPLIPRAQIHHRFREKHADILVVRIFLPDLAHRIGISLIERRAIFRLRIGVTMAERFDQVALDRRSVCRVLLRELQFLPRHLRGRRRHQRED